MDPQKLSQLDPKLKEAYMRVMGTDVPQPQTSSVQTQSPMPAPPASDPVSNPSPNPTPVPPQPQPEPTPTPTIEEPPTQPTEPPINPTIPEQQISEPQPTMPEPQPVIPQPEPVSPPAANFDQMNSEVAAASSQNFTVPSPMPQTQTMVVKKKSGMMPILVGIVGLVFVGVYTLFWSKLFNFKLPFLP